MEAFKKLQYMTNLTPKKRDQKKEIKKLAAEIKELKKENAKLRNKKVCRERFESKFRKRALFFMRIIIRRI